MGGEILAGTVREILSFQDGRKEVVAVVPGYRESVESWAGVLRDLRDRGCLPPPRLVIGDGHLGISGALRNVWPEAQEERCWNHKVLNVLEQLPRTQHRVAKTKLGAVAYAPTRAEAERKRREFEQWCSSTGTGRRRRRWGGTGTVW